MREVDIQFIIVKKTKYNKYYPSLVLYWLLIVTDLPWPQFYLG